MATFTACHSPFLQSRASLLIVGLGADGVILNPTLSRLFQTHESIKIAYKDLAEKGELSLGDVHLFETQKQTTGLSVGNNKTPNHIAIMVVNTSPKDSIKPIALKNACQKLTSQLFELMRYKNLRHIAIYTGNLLAADPAFIENFQDTTANCPDKQATAEKIWQLFASTLNISRITTEVHFDKSIDISSFIAQNPQEQA